MSLQGRTGACLLLVATITGGEMAVARLSTRADTAALKNRESIWIQRAREIDAGTSGVDVVFLGDSTVERAIDDAVFHRESGLTSMNLGLTGNLGTYGDYAALKRYLARRPAPRAAVVWHTPDVWARDPEPQLVGFTQPDVRDTLLSCRHVLLHPAGAKAAVAAPVEAGSVLLQHALMRVPSYRYRAWLKLEAGLSSAEPATALGATLPHRVLAEQIAQTRGATFAVSPQSRLWLGELVTLARRHGIAILAGRSPLHEEYRGHADTRPFVDQSNRMLTELYRTVPEVVEIATDNPVFRADQGYGDKEHVARAGREYLSAYYGRLVAAYLDAPPAEARR